MNEADATLRESFKASLERMPIFLAKVLGIIVVAWLIEWFIVEIARWIRRSSQRVAAHSSLDHNDVFSVS